MIKVGQNEETFSERLEVDQGVSVQIFLDEALRGLPRQRQQAVKRP
jgi:hypothetical protein